MDWSLLSCGRGGHVTYAPDETAVRAELTAPTPLGESWRCLRCGTFVPGPPGEHGPVSGAPRPRRGKEVRSTLILRIFSIERFIRALVFGGAAFGVWRFSFSRLSIEESFDDALPAVRRLYQDLGFSFQHSKLLGLVQHALRLNSHTLRWLALGLAIYAVLEIVEGVGLWLARRWGEYFAMIVTSIFLPYEIYELADKVTALRVAAFVINLALVLYLVLTKRLFGARGGKRAYEARLREDSLLDHAISAAAAAEVPAHEEGDVPDLKAETPIREGASPATDGNPAPDQAKTPRGAGLEASAEAGPARGAATTVTPPPELPRRGRR